MPTPNTRTICEGETNKSPNEKMNIVVLALKS